MTKIVNVAHYDHKIDNAPVDGLTGVANSLAYRVALTSRQFDNYEYWHEVAATPSGETHVADRVGDGAGAFRIDAGNDDWGAWVQLIGSTDTPVKSGNTHYSFHELFVQEAEKSATYFVQIGFGESGAAAAAADEVAEIVFVGTLGAGNAAALPIMSKRQAVGTKAWARCKTPGENTAYLDIFYGLHEYEG